VSARSRARPWWRDCEALGHVREDLERCLYCGCEMNRNVVSPGQWIGHEALIEGTAAHEARVQEWAKELAAQRARQGWDRSAHMLAVGNILAAWNEDDE
jgi:hypothetical protein